MALSRVTAKLTLHPSLKPPLHFLPTPPYFFLLPSSPLSSPLPPFSLPPPSLSRPLTQPAGLGKHKEAALRKAEGGGHCGRDRGTAGRGTTRGTKGYHKEARNGEPPLGYQGRGSQGYQTGSPGGARDALNASSASNTLQGSLALASSACTPCPQISPHTFRMYRCSACAQLVPELPFVKKRFS